MEDDASQQSSLRETPASFAVREQHQRADRFMQRQSRLAASAVAPALRLVKLVAGRSLLGRRIIARALRNVAPDHAAFVAGADPAALDVIPGRVAPNPSSKRALLVSNDLSASGAPKIVHELAVILSNAGYDVTVLSPSDGPMRALLVECGTGIVIGRAVLEDIALLENMARLADVAICNTVLTHTALRALGPIVPTYWYLHEISLLRDLLKSDPGLPAAAAAASQVWAGSEMSAALIRDTRPDVVVLPYGIDAVEAASLPALDETRPLRIAVFGAFELRKGQDLAVAAVAALAPADQARMRMQLFGRVLDKRFHDKLLAAAASIDAIEVRGELTLKDYHTALLDVDAVLVSSRDDTLPLVSIDALSSRRVLLCTPTTGTSVYLRNGVDGFIAQEPNAPAITAMLQEAIARRADWPRIGQAGRAVFETNFSRKGFTDIIFARLATDGVNTMAGSR